jgi:hypothetical protein
MQTINIEVKEMTTGLSSIIDAEYRPATLNNDWGGITATLADIGGKWTFNNFSGTATFMGTTTTQPILIINDLPKGFFKNPFSVGLKGIGGCLLKGASTQTAMEWEVKAIK